MLTTERRNVPVNLDIFENVPFSEIHALKIIQAPTPLEWIKTRETGYGQNKKKLSYVSGDTVERILNKAFNYRWSFEIIQQMVVPSADKAVKDKNTGTVEYFPQSGVVQCHGRMTVPGWGVREQWGAQIIVGGNETQEHAFKSAATDAMKKCASMFGIALDLYGTTGMYDLMSGTHDYAYDDKAIIEKYKEKLLASKEELKPAEVDKIDIPQRQSEDELIAEAVDAELAEAEAVTAAMPEPIVPAPIPVPEPIAPPVQTAPVQPTTVAPPVQTAAPVAQPQTAPVAETDDFKMAFDSLMAQGRIEEAAILQAQVLMESLDGAYTFEEVKASVYRDLMAKAELLREQAAQQAAVVPAPAAPVAPAAPAQTVVTGPNLSPGAPAQAAPADKWNADEVNRLKRLKKTLNVNNEGLLGYIQDFFGSADVTIHSVSNDNIADFNHYLEEIIADASNGAPSTQLV